jgi:capsular exopolysaccharide synthesis family protein
MSAGQSTLREYLAVLRRRKWVALAAIVTVPVIAVIFSELQSPRYSASAAVVLSRQNLSSSLNGVVDPTYTVDPQRLTGTQAQVARAPAVAAAVVKAARLNMSPGQFLAISSVSTNPEQDILGFHVTDRDPSVAARLANLYAAKYISYSTGLSTKAIQSARSEVEARLSSLEAAGNTSGALYANLVAKEQQLATMEALQAGNATLYDTASGAAQVQPTPKRDALLGLLVGIVLGLGLAFLRDHLDTRVRHAAEVSERLGLPLLARLPAPPKSLRSQNELVMLEDPTSHAAEPFRVLLSNIEFVSHERQPRTIMITSAREGEGKSTTAANLAVAFARTGKRVALVDLDLRRPFLHEFFHVPPEPGLTTMAVGNVALEDALVPVPLRSAGAQSEDDRRLAAGELKVLFSGRMPPNPGEFIRSRGVGRLIDHLSEVFDIVLIDAAPLLGLGDSLVLIPRVDAIVLVTRLELLRTPTLNELHRVLEGTSADALGIVVTAAERESDGDGYGYGSGYGYYGYGYGTNGDGPSSNGRSRPAARPAAEREEHV